MRRERKENKKQVTLIQNLKEKDLKFKEKTLDSI